MDIEKAAQKFLHIPCFTPVKINDHAFIHPDVIPAFGELKNCIVKKGADLDIISGHRTVERQLLIWNEKATGIRPVLDEKERPVDLSCLTEQEIVKAILRWSALPGLSRHHLGCDMDVYDPSCADRSEIKLLQEEWKQGGVCGNLAPLLAKALEENPDFYRPYMDTQSPLALEPWHLSFRPIAEKYSTPTKENLIQFIKHIDIELKDAILELMDDIILNSL